MNTFFEKRVWGPKPNYPLVFNYTNPNNHLITLLGPCSVESVDQINHIAKALREHQPTYLRGGVFRAGTYPGHDFGFQKDMVIALSQAAHENGMKCVMEVLDYREKYLYLYSRYADAFQVGARHMQDYSLLHILGFMEKTVFLKRNMGSTLDEFLGAAEHLLKSGSKEVTLIERGSSSFMNHVRWDLSLSLIATVKKYLNIPILVDPSHGTGNRDIVEPMVYAGLAAGADGFLMEVHQDPEKSLSDADQAFPLHDLHRVIKKAKLIKNIVP